MVQETEAERLDRELIELLNELRVALPGVQVLFAFLLTVPFSQRFDELSDSTVDVYFLAVLASALASVLLIAPAAHHRLRFRDHAKAPLIRVANMLALIGTVFLAIALGAAVYVVVDLVYGGGRAGLAAAAVTGGAAIVWFVVPLLYKGKQTRDGKLESPRVPTRRQSNMRRLEAVVAELPEAVRVDIAEWGDHPTFRVRSKNFVFCDDAATSLTVKLTKDEAEAVVATDPSAEPAGYGLGRHGSISFALEPDVDADRWAEVVEWIRTSYTLVAPKKLAQRVLDQDANGAT